MGSGPSEIFGESEKTDERRLAYAPKQEAPRRITQLSMSVPPPAPASPAVKAKPVQQPEPVAKQVPSSRFVPFWLTVLILAALLALIAWWLAS